MTFSAKTLAPALAALTLGGAVVATSAPAEAGWGYRHRGYGGAVAAGVIGGLAVGAMVAASRPAYAEPVYASDCYIVKRRFVNAWGEVVIRREQVCE
jgi:hypothetical protein